MAAPLFDKDKDLDPEELKQLLGFLGESGSGFASFGAGGE